MRTFAWEARLVLVAVLVFCAGCGQAVPAATVPDSTAAPAADTPATAPDASSPGGVPAAQPLLPDPAADHTVGDTIRLSGGEFVGDQADLTVVDAVMLPAGTTGSARRYAFLVEVTGLDPEVFPYNLRDFSLLDDQGFEYQPLPSGGQEPRLEFGDLTPGRKVRGWLTFEGPATSSYLELQYAPALALEPALVRVILPD